MPIEPEDFKFEHNNDEKEPKKPDYTVYIYIFLVVAVLGGYLYWSFMNPDTSDCNYTEAGCQGDNRWGQ